MSAIFNFSSSTPSLPFLNHTYLNELAGGQDGRLVHGGAGLSRGNSVCTWTHATSCKAASLIIIFRKEFPQEIPPPPPHTPTHSHPIQSLPSPPPPRLSFPRAPSPLLSSASPFPFFFHPFFFLKLVRGPNSLLFKTGPEGQDNPLFSLFLS